MTKQLIEIQAEGYKPHLCSTEEQAEIIIQDMKARKPTSECSTKVWSLPYLCFDDARPLAKEDDFAIMETPNIQLKYCVADFTSLVCSLNQGLECSGVESTNGDLVFLTSGLYCSVLSVAQAQELQTFIKNNYSTLKLKEDLYFIKYEKEIAQVDSVMSSLKGKDKKPVIIN